MCQIYSDRRSASKQMQQCGEWYKEMSLTIKALRLMRKFDKRSAGEKENMVLTMSLFASRITW